ncbi:hypothetical protein [Spirobacillus cienkowskii]|uniref:hypothetical protein n=1 Tax=Spirobacillus cienkowskii TaxID=495820 RepID=UPI0030D09E56
MNTNNGCLDLGENTTAKLIKKYNKQDLIDEAKINYPDINEYYKILVKICINYLESLWYFERAEFHRNQNNLILNNLKKHNILVNIWYNKKNTKKILTIIGTNQSTINFLEKFEFSFAKVREVLDGYKPNTMEKSRVIILPEELQKFAKLGYKPKNDSYEISIKIDDFLQLKFSLDNILSELHKKFGNIANTKQKNSLNYRVIENHINLVKRKDFDNIINGLGFKPLQDTPKVTIEYEELIYLKNILENIYDKNKNLPKASFKFYYPEMLEIKKDLENIFDKYKLDEIFENLNSQIVKQCNNRSVADRSDFYLTLTDDEIFNYYASHVIRLHNIIFSFMLMGVTSGLSAATVLPEVVSLESYKNFIILDQSVLLFKNLYKVFLKNTSYYKFNQEKLLVDKYDYKKLKDILLQLRKVNSKIEDFNFYLCNSFKYYAKIKQEINILENDYISNKGIFSSFKTNEKNEIVDNKLNHIKLNYYKCLSYFNRRNILENTLRVQLNSFKVLTVEMATLVRGSSEFKIFLRYYKQKYNENYVDKKIQKILYEICKNNYSDVYFNLIKLSLYSEKERVDDLSKLEGISEGSKSIKDDITENMLALGSTFSFSSQIRNIAAHSPIIDNFFKNLNQKSTELDIGLYLFLSAIDGILFLTTSVSAKDKYKKIMNLISKISSYFNVACYGLGVVFVINKLWNNIFTSSIIDNFYLNPFQLFSKIFSYNFEKSISGNYQNIWKDICNDFEEFEKNYRNKPYSLVYDYFILKRKSDPLESMYHISRINKEKLKGIAESQYALNELCNSFLNKVKKFNKEKVDVQKSSCFSFSRIFSSTEKMEDEIITDYIKAIFAIFFQAKQIESYESYLLFLDKVNIEIDNFLKTNLVLLTSQNKEIFSVLNFAKYSGINEEYINKK